MNSESKIKASPSSYRNPLPIIFFPFPAFPNFPINFSPLVCFTTLVKLPLCLCLL